VPGRWIDPIATPSGKRDGVTLHVKATAAAGLLVIVQEADLPEPTDAITEAMYPVIAPDEIYPLGNFADTRTRVWVRGAEDVAVDFIAWEVRN
jgi:hypothetical protein